jgi:hypothetical protein
MAKNGGIDNVFNDLDKKNEYEKFLTKLLGRLGELEKPSIKWIQKRNKK